MTSVHVLIIGGASLDTLAGADSLVAGGAGMYTAMSAYRFGASVTLFAPRPLPIPEALATVAESLNWIGPTIDIADLAHFKINYDAGITSYETSHFGAEASLTPADLPHDLSEFDVVHVIPLGNIEQQHEMVLACRNRGASIISAGTALHLIERTPQAASAVLQEADLFFMNAEEAVRLFGSLDAVRARPDQFLFVTMGSEGALVVQGSEVSHIAGKSADVVDPTGAGDAFCGATIVGLALGEHPQMAVRKAMPLAASVTERVGAASLLDSSTTEKTTRNERVSVNPSRIESIAKLIENDDDITAFDFTGPDLPNVDDPATLDYFFAVTLQQFGFWTAANGKYDRPLIATVDQQERKGSFYLFRAYLRWLRDDPERLSPAGQAALSKADLLAVLRDDDGSDPMPAIDLHLKMARQYGQDMLALNLTPQAIVRTASSANSPLTSLLATLDQIGGYKEDPLRKKSALLAIILQQRPESFFDHRDKVPAVVDYHIMRSCLRTGLIDVGDGDLKAKLLARQLLSQTEEWAVRSAAHTAIKTVAKQSGKSMGAVDWFFFQARKRCPELTEPNCAQCAIDPACAHRKDLFQPVRRTSFY